MDTNANKRLVDRFVREVFEARNADAIDELVADEFESHTWPDTKDDPKASLREAAQRMSKALDDVSFTVDDAIAEGDRVVVRLTASARPVAEFMGMAPSGRSYTVSEIHIFRVADGKIAEHWHQLDAMGLMKQLKPEG